MSLSAIFLPFQTLSLFSLYLTSPTIFMHTSSFFFITSRALARRQRCNRQIIINKGTSVAAVYKERDVCTRNFFVSFLNINWREELNSYHREMVATCCIHTHTHRTHHSLDKVTRLKFNCALLHVVSDALIIWNWVQFILMIFLLNPTKSTYHA